MIQVYALKLSSDISEASFRLLCSQVSAEKQDKIEKFLRREDALRCLYADLLIRYILIQDHGITNERISFGHTEFGKPFCIGHEHIHFNISHSGEWIVCATDDRPVGIDIERIAPVEMEVAEHYFSQEECRKLRSLSGDAQTHYFYDLWTCKESYLKLNGMGLSAPLDTFTISVTGDVISISPEEEIQQVFFKQYDIDPRYKMAVCGYSDPSGDIRSVTQDKLNSSFLV